MTEDLFRHFGYMTSFLILRERKKVEPVVGMTTHSYYDINENRNFLQMVHKLLLNNQLDGGNSTSASFQMISHHPVLILFQKQHALLCFIHYV